MDLLRQELNRKKSLLAKATGFSGSVQKQQQENEDNKYQSNKKKRKYMKQSEIRRLEEEEEEEQQQRRKEQERLQRQKKEKESGKHENNTNDFEDDDQRRNTKGEFRSSNKRRKESSNTDQDISNGGTTEEELTKTKQEVSSSSTSTKVNTLSPETIRKQLRALGLPVCFFGETFKEKELRLKEALAERHQTLQGLSEMEEFRLGQGHGIRNPFLEKDEKGKTKSVALRENEEETKEELAEQAKRDEQEEENDNSDDDPPKKVYKFLKGLLKQWEGELEARSSSLAKSVAGRNESKTLKQCKDYIRPLFKQLKKRKLEPGLLAHLVKIVDFAKEGEFVKAHDAYIDVAIGRAAWPIGVTMVGIHARSGRAKIESANVAHVMNSELQRKYLTSVKRLLTYAQKVRTDVDPSKKVS